MRYDLHEKNGGNSVRNNKPAVPTRYDAIIRAVGRVFLRRADESSAPIHKTVVAVRVHVDVDCLEHVSGSTGDN